jgi:hypothetical protein
MKEQFVVIHIIRKTEIPAPLNSWVRNTLSVKIYYPQKLLPFIFSQKYNVFELNVGLLRIYQVSLSLSLSFSSKIVYRLVTTNCCFMRGIVLFIVYFQCRSTISLFRNEYKYLIYFNKFYILKPLISFFQNKALLLHKSSAKRLA